VVGLDDEVEVLSLGGGDALAAFVRTEFREVRRLADLPAKVRKALEVDAYPMAEAGADWNRERGEESP
jgi:hypothetical protein